MAGEVGWNEYNKSQVAAPTGYDTSNYGNTNTGSKGEWGTEVALMVIFYDEVMKISRMSTTPPNFDMGTTTESLGKGQYKVKMAALGSVVTAINTLEANAATFPWQNPAPLIPRGSLCLILCQPVTKVGGYSTIYYIMAQKQIASYNGETPEYPV